MRMTNRKRIREDTAARRAQIVGEAMVMIGQCGSRGFTIQGVARRCGLSNAGVLYYFDSKDDLLLALIGEIERGEEEAIVPILASVGSAGMGDSKGYGRAVEVMRLIANRQCETPELLRLITTFQTEAMSRDHHAHTWFVDRASEAEALFARLFAPWTETPQLSARLLLALLQGLTRRWLEENGSFDLGEHVEQGVRALVPFADPELRGYAEVRLSA